MSTAHDESWGLPHKPGRRAWWPRIVKLLLLAALISALAFPWWLSSQVTRIDVAGLSTDRSSLHILVVGSDSREGLSEEQQSVFGADSVDGERADTIFVLSLDGGKAAVLAFPRDLWVERCDGTMGRINSATAISGPSCLVRTVRDLSGINLNHYMALSFGGFATLVDSIGGVELCLDEAISDRDAHIDLPAGCQRLNGADALGFVRVRKIDNDLMRIQRQQEFVQAFAREFASPARLLNPLRLAELASDSGHAVRVDERMGVLAMARLALGARGLGRGSGVINTVPVDPRTTSDGAAVLEMRIAEAEELFAAHRTGSIFDDILDLGVDADIRPSEVQVTI
ncbi:MAG: LCP family protein, partial [Acidimicrobiia bacterium]